MQKEIDISKYTACFHDGSLFGISKRNDEIAFQMSSAEVDSLGIPKELTLSEDNRIRGVLHLRGIQDVHLTGEYKIENLFEVFSLGTILDFEIENKTVQIGVLWENCPPKLYSNEFTTIMVQARHVLWENIPGLKYPIT